MGAKFCLALVAFGQLCAVAMAQEQPVGVISPSSAGSATYITHVTVIDTETGRESGDRTVVISGDRISEVKDSKRIKVPPTAKILNGTGRYLIPGLWDMHVHAVFSERLDSMLPMFVANGVLGIRDMGTAMPLAEIAHLREEIAQGKRIGPRIVAAGPLLDGHPKPMRPNFLAITTPEEGRTAVRRLKDEGSDFIKVYSWLSRDSFLAIATEANNQKIPFAGHVPFSVSALEASDAGQKSMEHLYGIALACSARDEELRSELVKGGASVSFPVLDHVEIEDAYASYSEEKAAKVFAHLAKNHTWQVPTFAADLPYSRSFDDHVTHDERLRYIPRTIQAQWGERATAVAGTSPWEKFFVNRLKMLNVMHGAGVPVLAGTDSAWYQPYTYAGFSLHDELALLVQAGLTPAESLQAATLSPARYLGMEKSLGTIREGKLADLVLLSADPLQDIGNTQKIDAVIVDGRLLDRKALDFLLTEAENAVKKK
jgi:imidazolonepropionase-like amidohydrolase